MQARLLTRKADVRNWVKARRADGARTGLVPTMGALHEGHLSLVRAAASECGAVAVSIFVNPTQFAPGEDLDRYPRRLRADRALASEAGAHVVFAPSPEEMYADGAATHVDVDGLTEPLCGASRPGHFRGVTTVVAKLFHIIPADAAFFGHKDFQQAVVIRQMVRDLDFDIQVRVCPTVREPDGLAMSSRNAYLGGESRRRALALYRALSRARQLFAEGQRDRMRLTGEMRRMLDETAPGAAVEYAEIVNPRTLAPADPAGERSVAVVAAVVDGTRLIDNMPMTGETAL